MFKKHNTNYSTIIPMIVEKTSRGDRSYDIYSKLLKERIIFLSGVIDDNLSNSIISQLLFLESKSQKNDIYLYINSPGGLITSGISIYDTMQFIQPDISTICIGQACSMAALLLTTGTKGKRFSLPNSRIMIHQPLGQYKGQATDIEIHANEIILIKKKINKIMSLHTGKDIKKIEQDTERDYFLSSSQALKYGIIDSILKSRK
ncbi:ATP-dependent Clp endopeptidase proteolytic subunit ClpP [Buchnera aphidicola (Chaitoregma tattakana)]|uniref:ATP-dependent Clp endopeptidase proteolytic subunit ClpP n=1 Tax=Buchnera aphidicola TaxID=9 RepID=UPI0031B81D85